MLVSPYDIRSHASETLKLLVRSNDRSQTKCSPWSYRLCESLVTGHKLLKGHGNEKGEVLGEESQYAECLMCTLTDLRIGNLTVSLTLCSPGHQC
jgi:hypothetical protein